MRARIFVADVFVFGCGFVRTFELCQWQIAPLYSLCLLVLSAEKCFCFLVL